MTSAKSATTPDGPETFVQVGEEITKSGRVHAIHRSDGGAILLVELRLRTTELRRNNVPN